MRIWFLGLLVASCAAPRPEVPRDLQQLLTELHPAVATELGVPLEVCWSVWPMADLPSPIATVLIDGTPRYLGYRQDWAPLSSGTKRLAVAHELVHLCGPVLDSYAISEGLADYVATRVEPKWDQLVWADHWVTLVKATVEPEDLLRQAPRSAKDDAELRALGFMALYVMPRDELLELQQGTRTGADVLSDRRWVSINDLVILASDIQLAE